MLKLPDERTLIRHIRSRLPAPPPALRIGPGDDAAVIEPERGAFQVLTTDVVIEGVHFDRRWSSLSDVGHKALAVNLSDLAAMGATPTFALLSMGLPEWTTIADVDALLEGALQLAAVEGVTIAGGNLSRSPGPLMMDVTALGFVRPRRVLARSGGRAGDAIYVTGKLGAAAAGLDILRTIGPSPTGFAGCLDRHRRPTPRTRIGRLLGRNRAASACMDLSDGLADALSQVAEASKAGVLIDASALPIDPEARRWFESRGIDAVLAALAGGDDFELLFTVPRKFRGRLRAVDRERRGIPLTRIGELTDGAAVLLSRDGVTIPIERGFSHF